MTTRGIRSFGWSSIGPSERPMSDLICRVRSIRVFSSSFVWRARAPDSLLRLVALESEADHSLARDWIEEFKEGDIPKDTWVASYSRSSGPGGQVSPSPFSPCPSILHSLPAHAPSILVSLIGPSSDHGPLETPLLRYFLDHFHFRLSLVPLLDDDGLQDDRGNVTKTIIGDGMSSG